MRDLERIRKVLGKLEFYWRKHPELRLGQLIYKAHEQPGEGTPDLFNIEDEELERRIIDLFLTLS